MNYSHVNVIEPIADKSALVQVTVRQQTIIWDCVDPNYAKKFCTLIQISLKFVPKAPIDNNPALV